MATCDAVALSRPLPNKLRTYAGAATQAHSRDFVLAWQSAIATVEGFYDSAGTEDDDGYALPSDIAIRWAVILCEELKSSNTPAPGFIVSDGEGGIALERRSEGKARRYRIKSNGEVESLFFEDARLIDRKVIARFLAR